MSDKLPIKLVEWTNMNQAWPDEGHQLLATFDRTTIILYITCPAELGKNILNWRNFRKDLSYLRMNWTLTSSFMGVLHTSQWATRKYQDCILALTIFRSGFEKLLKEAIALEYIVMPMAEYNWLYEYDPSGVELSRSILELKIRSVLVEDLIDEMLLDFHDVTESIRNLKLIADEIPKKGNCDLSNFKVAQEKPYKFMDPGIPPGIQLPYRSKSPRRKERNVRKKKKISFQIDS